MKTFETQAAQGDLLILKIDKLPAGLVEEPQKAEFVVQHSETGHNHVVFNGSGIAKDNSRVRMFVDGKDPLTCYLQVEGETCVEHQRSYDKHDSLKLLTGNYMIKRQQEFTPEGWRAVID